MLERAARCIETAGQQILRCSKNPLRSNQVLRTNFWHHGAADIDVPFWCLGFLSPAGEAHGAPLRQSTALDRSSSSSSSFLEFLYPPQTKAFARSYLRTRSLNKGMGARRRKRIPYRGYTTDNIATAKAAISGEATEAQVLHDDSYDECASAGLRQLFSTEDIPNYSKAWNLFQAAGSPDELAHQMLTYLSTSDKRRDAERTRWLFDQIPISKRRSADYLCAVKIALVWSPKNFEVKGICHEAVSRNEGQMCCEFAISFLINRRRWPDALEIWNSTYGLRVSRKPKKFNRIPEFADLPSRVPTLLTKCETGVLDKGSPGLVDLIKSMVDNLVCSQKCMMDMSTKSIIALFEQLNSLQLIESRFYFSGLATLQLVHLRPASVRSIVLYRNLRWRLPNVRVPQELLHGILRKLSTLEIAEGVEYFLEEYRYFYNKPSQEAYRYGLTTFSRLGMEEEVSQLFSRYVGDYGIPSDLKILSPLLYVHARAGQVEKTRKQLERLSSEFKVSPNVVCWNILLTAHARASDLDGALATFRRMVEKEVAPDTYTFGSLMGILANKGDVDAVIEIFGFAKRSGALINCALIDSIVGALCNNRRYLDAEKVAKETLNLNISGSPTRMWNVLLWNYALIPDIEAVSRIQTQMQQRGIEFDGMSYAALMQGLVRINRHESARQILGKLHRSRRIHITEFHYAILLRGYVKVKNRDMVTVLYKEMVERFEKVGLSGSLSILKSQIGRDLQRFHEKAGPDTDKPLDLPHAERFLDLLVENFDISALATKQPQPGIQKRSVNGSFPSIYYEPVVLAYGLQGEFEKANKILEKHDQDMEFLSLDHRKESIHLLHAKMVTFLKQRDHRKVDTCWQKAVKDMTDAARPTVLNRAMFQQAADVIDDLKGFQTEHQAAPISNSGNNFLPSYRFTLSRCLSVLMQSLSQRNLLHKISSIISEIEKIGFVVTTFNWSLYVKLLCLSKRPADQLHAFTIFEKKFISQFISWKHIKHGYTKRPDDAPSGLDFLERRSAPLKNQVLGKAGRRAWAAIKPDALQPTYLTMIYLASALIDFRARSIASGEGELDRLLTEAPRTVDAVAKLPYLREKFQGILLRGRRDMKNELGPEPINTAEHVVWTGGILGANGEHRIDTAPALQVVNESMKDGTLTGRIREYTLEPGIDLSEPDATVTGARFATDANWDEASLESSEYDSDQLQKTLAAQDELDLDIESTIENEG